MTPAAQRVRRVLLAAVAVALVEAGPAAGQSGPVWGRAPGWLTCIDKPASYLNALVQSARLRPDSILAFLDSAVRRGPGSATVLDYEQSLRRLHSRIFGLLRVRHGYIVRPDSVYVTDYARRLEATWRVRAALALGRIAYVYRSPQDTIGRRAAAILRRLGRTLAPSPELAAVQRAQNTAFVRDSLPH